MTKGKRAGAKMALTKRSHYCNFQIYHSPVKAHQGRIAAAHTAGPLGSTRPSPATQAAIGTIRMSLHSRTDGMAHDQKHHKKEKSRAKKWSSEKS